MHKALSAIVCFFSLGAFAQNKMGFEQYLNMGRERFYLSSIVNFQNNKNWCLEARYNYEEMRTFSLYLGKTFFKENKFSYSFTPSLGVMTGNLQGGSVSLNMNLNYLKFNFSSQSEYCMSSQALTPNFFFNWSEFTYQPLHWFYTGLSIQHTRINYGTSSTEAGFLFCLTAKPWSFPLYCFSPLGEKKYFIFGINFEWGHLTTGSTKVTKPALNNTLQGDH